ncbi:hypothetical protein MKW94_026494 [Papaver nudicaule]|uniref:N-acetyltransferase domain-containing protein n=1 Tax=Papaver nudicaule TaxID=74823 RepID=A0AA41RNP1_PAPNU|nr:hypothetical protein [Papaver nudicaule]
MCSYIGTATLADIPEIKACDLVCFPEEDPVTYSSLFKDSILSPHRVVYVAEYDGRIAGYVVVKMLEDELAGEEEKECRQGYILCLGVHPTYRNLGIATKLMTAAENAMVQEYHFEYVYLHVRVSNHAAINLYAKILGYQIHDTAAKFNIEGEEAYVMRKQLQGKQPHFLGHRFTHGDGFFWTKASLVLGWLLEKLFIAR